MCEKKFACFPEALSRRRNILFEPTGKDLPRLVNPFLGAICRSAIDIFVAKYISAKTHTIILPIDVHMEDEYFEEEWFFR